VNSEIIRRETSLGMAAGRYGRETLPRVSCARPTARQAVGRSALAPFNAPRKREQKPGSHPRRKGGKRKKDLVVPSLESPSIHFFFRTAEKLERRSAVRKGKRSAAVTSTPGRCPGSAGSIKKNIFGTGSPELGLWAFPPPVHRRIGQPADVVLSSEKRFRPALQRWSPMGDQDSDISGPGEREAGPFRDPQVDRSVSFHWRRIIAGVRLRPAYPLPRTMLRGKTESVSVETPTTALISPFSLTRARPACLGCFFFFFLFSL